MKKVFKPLAFLVMFLFLFASLSGCNGKAEETFRNARVISVSGTATLLRGEVSMALYEGLVLQGGDQITTAADGRVDLKLDEDKYIVLEANTEVTLELEGDPQRGAIRLRQVCGTIHHTIENPLAKDDSYEVHTPDAVMAVRGTEFSTTVTDTEQGTQTTTDVEEGSVEMTPNNSEEPPEVLGPGESAAAGTEPGGSSHFLTLCPQCAQAVDTLEEHCLACGDGHYSCDGNNHEMLSCDHYACAGGDHVTQHPCGHLACTEGDHATQRLCGHYVCAEGNHEKLSCGNYACREGHRRQDCGHCICNGDHSQYPCGHYACNGGDMSHERLPCGNYECAGNGHTHCYGCGGCSCTGEHSQYPCGHLACQGGAHDPRPCGHFTCDPGDHGLLSCGHYACDGKDHSAYLDCGNLLCAEGHVACVFCGQCVCTGTHGDGICNPVV